MAGWDGEQSLGPLMFQKVIALLCPVCIHGMNCWSRTISHQGRNYNIGYDECCRCGNAGGNFSGLDQCWTSSVSTESTFAACCNFYGSAATLSSLPCWRDVNGVRRAIELNLLGRSWKFEQKFSDGSNIHSVMSRVLWPTAYALAAYLAAVGRHLFVGQRVVELGSGLAFPAMVATFLGAAQVIATDTDRAGLRLAAAGASQNLPLHRRPRFMTHRIDFRDVAKVATLAPADLVLCAGQLYDPALLQPLLNALLVVCTRGCRVLMTMGGSWPPDQPLGNHFLELVANDFETQEVFPCEDRGLAHHSSGIACIMLASRQQAGLAMERVSALEAAQALVRT